MMHFSIPETQEFVDSAGNSFTGFNIHINGSFHCCLRYKQLHCLHEQLKRSLSSLVLPSFPPKKLLPLTNSQLESRRAALERYIQLLGQDPVLSKSDLLRIFLLNAQQESAFVDSHDTVLDVYLLNGYRISINVFTTDCATKVLDKACNAIDLSADYACYFSLFLMRKENDGGVTLTRRLMDFEAPYISQRMAEDCNIVIRKNYWDPNYDLELMRDRIALNLLYIQTVCDVEKGWIVASKDVKEQLGNLQARGSKKEYLEMARNLTSYGCIQFPPCCIDYPEQNTMSSVVIGNRELCFRTMVGKKVQETKFKVTRMRCWRVITIHNNEEMSSNSSSDSQGTNTLELSFEYLMSKSCLKWITIVSEQAMLMSVCLQSMVDELLNQKASTDTNNVHANCSNGTTVISYIRRDGSSNRISESNSLDTICTAAAGPQITAEPARKPTTSNRNFIKNRISTTVLFQRNKESVHNEAFEEIGDDDL